MRGMTTPSDRPRLSVSTWSLHAELGRPPITGPANEAQRAPETGTPLIELPAKIAAFGIPTMEVCHFHLPSRDRTYLGELGSAIRDSGTELFSLLIDNGDITDPLHGSRDQAWITGWIETAGQLGSRCARVIAGKQESTAENRRLAIERLRELAAVASANGVRLMTENWFALLDHPDAVNEVIDALDGRLGLCLDFGNWSAPGKYDDFPKIARHAESCHTKADFDDGGSIDSDDYRRCLEIVQSAGFSGPHTLIFGDREKHNEWDGLRMEMDIVQPYC